MRGRFVVAERAHGRPAGDRRGPAGAVARPAAGRPIGRAPIRARGSVLVVVDVMPRVAVVAVDVVQVILVGHRGVPAAVLVDVHVAGVRTWWSIDAGSSAARVVDVVLVDVVDVPVVEEVDVVLVGHRGVPAEAVVDVGMLAERVVGGGFCHRALRRATVVPIGRSRAIEVRG